MTSETAVLDLAEALRGLGVDVRAVDTQGDVGHDLVLDPGATPIWVAHRSLVDDLAASRLLADVGGRDGMLVVVSDRITAAARRTLIDGTAGYYDGRGHIALRTPHLVIDADVDPFSARTDRVDPLGGAAGLEIGAALLVSPISGTPVRRLARETGRSPSTVSDVLRGLRQDGLVDEEHRVVGTDLFWRVAERWRPTRTYLAELPPAGQAARITGPLRLGLDAPEQTPGWALTESAAAAAYDAPVAVRSDQPLEFHVPDAAVVRRAEQLLGVASSPARAACAVRVAPVPAVCSRRVDTAANPFAWPLAHPVFVALDLAQDRGRGHEILDAWTPAGWPRVW
ncbi:MAG: transcriptional regulator [Cellulomonas sp.]